MTNPILFESFPDFNGTRLQFQITILNVGDKFCASADEVTDNNNHRTFRAYDPELPEAALTKLRRLIKEELATRYFKPSMVYPFEELNGDLFRGHVGETDDGDPVILVDGYQMTLEDFGEFLKPLNGFRIEVKVLE